MPGLSVCKRPRPLQHRTTATLHGATLHGATEAVVLEDLVRLRLVDSATGGEVSSRRERGRGGEG